MRRALDALEKSARHVVPAQVAPVVVGPPTKRRAKFPFVGTIELPGGLVIDVENLKGSFREGVDPGGTPWRVEMHAHYGELRGTEGADGEPLDVYVGDNADSPLVVVVHQQDPRTREYDEDKVMLGFRTVAEALALYRKQYDRPGFYQDHTTIPITSFWRWVQARDQHGGKLVMKSAGVTWVEVPERWFLAGLMMKALGHKYEKKVPVGTTPTGRIKYRYFYGITGGRGHILHDEDLDVVGASFRGDGGHWEVQRVDQEGVVLRHDETGEVRELTHQDWRDLLAEHHGAAIAAHRDATVQRREAEYAAAKRSGSPRVMALARKRLEEAGGSVPDEPPTTEDVKALADVEADEAPVVHEEVGEHVFGARRDLAAPRRGSRADELKARGKATKAEVFGRFSLLDHVGNGGTVGGWHVKAWIAKSIGAKAPPAHEDAYIEGCTHVAKTLERCKTPEDVQVALKELRDWTMKAVPIGPGSSGPVSLSSMGQRPSHEELKAAAPPGHAFAGTGWSYDRGGSVAFYAPVAAIALGERFLKLLHKASPGLARAMSEARRLDRESKDAQAYAAEHARKLGYTLDQARTIATSTRTGGRVIDGVTAGRVTGEAVAGHFGLKNVDYGNWMSNADRDQHLRDAAGALTDLADLLGVQDSAVALGGRLAVGFGARGKGGAAAHYEPGGNVINLTKFSGGGSLAHEFGHFLDHVAAGNRPPDGHPKEYGSVAVESLPPKSRAAMDSLVRELDRSSFGRHARALDEGKKKAYWCSRHEMFARLFESWAEDTLTSAGRKSTYLVHGTQGRQVTGVKVAEAKGPLPPEHLAEVAAAEKKAKAVIKAQAAVHAPRASNAWTYWGVSDAVLEKLKHKSPEVREALDDYWKARRRKAQAENENTEKVHAQPYPQGAERARLVGSMAAVVDAMKADGVLAGLLKAFLGGGPMARVVGMLKAKRGGGPYIGPKGGKWADPEHTIPWKEARARHPRDQSPDVVGPVRVGMSLPEVERALMEAHDGEYAVIFGRDGRQLGRARWESETRRQRVTVPPHMAIAAAADGVAVVSHNHPGGTMLSTSDIRTALALNLKEIRAVCPDGVVWSLRRRGKSWGLSGGDLEDTLHDLETMESQLFVAATDAEAVGNDVRARKLRTRAAFEVYQEYLGEAGLQGVLAALRVRRDRRGSRALPGDDGVGQLAQAEPVSADDPRPGGLKKARDARPLRFGERLRAAPRRGAGVDADRPSHVDLAPMRAVLDLLRGGA